MDELAPSIIWGQGDMSRNIQVIGNYGLASETVLHNETSTRDATEWARSYIRWGDFGGYESISVVEDAGNSLDAFVHWERFQSDEWAQSCPKPNANGDTPAFASTTQLWARASHRSMAFSANGPQIVNMAIHSAGSAHKTRRSRMLCTITKHA